MTSLLPDSGINEYTWAVCPTCLTETSEGCWRYPKSLRIKIPQIIVCMGDAFHHISWYEGEFTTNAELTEKIELILTELKSNRAEEFMDNIGDIV